jgi:YD repeat-containing protein
MVNYIKLFFLLMVFLNHSLLFSSSGPEKFDHLRNYKLKNVPNPGPKTEKVFVGDNQVAYANYIYNKQNQLIKANYYDGKNKQTASTVFTYNNKGISKEISYDKNGNPYEEIVYSIDSQGRTKEYNVYDHKFNQKIKWKFSYLGKDLLSGKRYIDEVLTESFRIKDKSNGNYAQELYNAIGERNGFLDNIYFDNKLQKRIKYTNAGMKEIHYKYNKNGKISEMKFFSYLKGKKKLEKVHRLYFKKSVKTGT